MNQKHHITSLRGELFILYSQKPYSRRKGAFLRFLTTCEWAWWGPTPPPAAQKSPAAQSNLWLSVFARRSVVKLFFFFLAWAALQQP